LNFNIVLIDNFNKFLPGIPTHRRIDSKLLIFLTLQWMLASFKLYPIKEKIQWENPSSYA